MGSNHLNDIFRSKIKKETKFPVPTHDPQTGEINVEYEKLTGKKNPLLIKH